MDYNQLIIVLFGILYIAFIIYTRRKGNFEEFSVAGRSLGAFLIFSSICATYVGPAMTMGLTRDGFNNGMFLAFVAMFNGFALIVAAFIYAPKVRAKFVNSYSIGDVLAGPLSHNHKAVKIAVGIISLWFLASLTIAMSYAGGELINNVFGFPKVWSIAILTAIVIVYSSFGGIRATIQTDAFQLINFVILIPVLAFMMITSKTFSWEAFQLKSSQATSIAFNAETFSGILGMILFWIFSGAGFDAPTINRFLASKNTATAKRAAIYAGVFIFFWVFLMIFIGSIGATLHPEIPDNDQILLSLAELYFPGIFYGIFIIAMIGVVMSTQDTALNGAAIVFSEDIIGGFNPNITDKQKLLYSRILTFMIGIIAILVAGFLDSILQVVIVIFSFYLPVMIPVILFSVLKDKHHWQSAIASMATGFFTAILWENFGSKFLSSMVVGIALSSLVYWVVDMYLDHKI